MVIYWFGFVEELRQRRDDGVLITERLPANIELLRTADV